MKVDLMCLIICFVCGTIFGYMEGNKRVAHELPTSHRSDSSSTQVSTSRIQAVEKTNPNEPDLVVSQRVSANINGEVVDVPVKKTSSPSSAASGDLGTSTYLTQEIDITPLLSEMSPDWELGMGVSRINGETYVPMSLQRNYKTDKAIELVVFYDLSERKTDGVSVLHKWRF